MARFVSILLSSLSCLGCLACGNKDIRFSAADSTVLFKAFPDLSKLNFDKLIKYDQTYARGVFLTDSSIILTNDRNLKSDYFFYEYSLATKQLVGKYVKNGTKKGMTIGPLSFGFYNKRKLFIRDISLKKIIVADLSDKYSFDSVAVEEYASPQFAYSVQLLNNNRILKSGIENTPEILQVTDLVTDSSIKTLAQLPPAPDGMPIGSWKHANQGLLFVKPDDQTKAVLASKFSDQLEIIDLKNGKSIGIKGPENIELAFVPVRAGEKNISVTTEKTVHTFRNGAVTKKYIYLLYSGSKESEENYTEGKFIYIYDWAGKPIRKLELSNYISGFAITEDDSSIYAFDVKDQFIVKSSLGNK